MFEKQYKSAMNKVVPSEDALNKTLKAMKDEANPTRKRKQIIRRSIICAAAVFLVFSSVFTAFRISDALKYSGGKYSLEGYGKMTGLKAAGSEKAIESAIADYNKNSSYYLDYETYEAGNLLGWLFPSFDSANEIANGEGLKGDGDVLDSPNGTDTPDHSDTNNQVSGVQEADVVKNDGRYIYYCSVDSRTLYICEVDDGSITKLSETAFDVEDLYEAKEMLLIGDKLAIICDYKNYKYDHYMVCIFYDVADRSSPKLVNTSRQSGYYVSSRAIGDYVYIISRYCEYNDEVVLPEVNGETIDIDSAYLPDRLSNTAFTVVTSYNAGSDGCGNADSISVLGVSNILYSGKSNLYLTVPCYINKSGDQLRENQRVACSKTDIYRIELNGGKMAPTAFGSVPGTLNNQFSIDESGDTLRIATNIQYATVESFVPFYGYRLNYAVDDDCNKVFCLDDNLDIIGESEPLGISEQIKSVRYIGDIAYVVTFRQTDPLYAVDLSNPKKPKTLSELKIDGFSTYMHPYGDGLLLGIGYDATSNGRTTGLKLTMFDISDPTKAYDVSSCIFDWNSYQSFSDSTALYNHKAVLIDAKKNIIAIPISERKEIYTTETVINEYGKFDEIEEFVGYQTNTYFVFFDFDGKTLSVRKRVEVCESDEALRDLRGLYIGNYGYLVHSEGIISVDLNTFKTVETLVYDE